jgi:hypothetical protein
MGPEETVIKICCDYNFLAEDSISKTMCMSADDLHRLALDWQRKTKLLQDLLDHVSGIQSKVSDLAKILKP